MRKNNRHKRKCSECPHCEQYFHNMRNHNNVKHGGGDVRKQVRDSQQRRRKGLTAEKKQHEREGNKKQMKEKRAADNTSNKQFSCRKCSHGFKVKWHSQNCACKQCPYCGKWYRNVNVHIHHEHPEHHVTEKLDLYKVMRMQCLRGIIDFRYIWKMAQREIPV